MKVYYTGTDGASHYEAWTDYVVEENQWLDVTVDIGNNGNDVRLTAKNTSTGLSYFKSISTNLGSAAASVEIAVQYRHNEFSKTDFVDARISGSDFGISASPTQVYVFPGCPGISTITLQSVGGFSGSVSLSAFVSPATYTYARVIDSIVNVPSGGSAIATATVGTSASWTGTYTAVVMGVSGSTFHWTSFTVNADWDNDACSGYGQGSVASGTLITLADRSEVPVQNLHEGMQLLSYDVNTRQYANSTITRMDVVSTSNMLVIRTEDPLPLRLDNATAQRLWIRKSDGRVGWFSVTQLRVGDYLFNVLGQRWAQVLDISYVKGGIHTMYDIYNTSPFDYIANGYLDPQKNGPS